VLVLEPKQCRYKNRFECLASTGVNAPETVLPSIVNSGFQTGELGVLKSVTIVAVHQEPLAIGRDVVLLVVGIG